VIRLAEDLELPVDVVTQTISVLARRGAGKTHTASKLVEGLAKAGQHFVVIDPTGAWWGLRSSADGLHDGLPVIIFGGDHADLPLPANAGAYLADLIIEQRISAVLDLSGLRKPAFRRLVREFMERLYERNREPLHLVVDEADLFAPQGRSTGDMPELVGAYTDIVLRGRRKGLGCTSITQRPASLHTDVRSQSEILIAMQMTGVHDIAAIDAWVAAHAEPGEAAEVRASLPSLPIGTAWIWSPSWLKILRKVKILPRETFDSSATPRPGQGVIEPARRAAVDLDVLRTRLEEMVGGPDTPAGTPASGPGSAALLALNRRIRELEAQVAVPTVVTVPAVDPDTLEQLGKLARDLQELGTNLLAAVDRATAAALRQHAVPDAPSTVPDTRRAGPDTQPSAVPHPAGTSRRAAARPGPDVPDGQFIAPDGYVLSRAERAIMAVLTSHGVHLSGPQLSILSGYSGGSSSFKNAISALRVRTLLAGSVTTSLVATDVGRRVMSGVAPMPTGRALVDYWTGRLAKAERTILYALLDVWPRGLPKADLAAASGYSPTSSSFKNACSRLRTINLANGYNEMTAIAELGRAWKEAQ
jgi:hypothetical protein